MSGRSVAMTGRTAGGLLGLVLGMMLAALPLDAVAAKKETRLGLAELGRRYGLQATWTKPGHELRLHSRWTTLEFRAGSREAAWNGLRLFLGEPVEAGGGTLRLAESDWRAIVRPLLEPAAVSAPGALELIVIDPGHGGSDPGTVNRTLKLEEKTLTLDVAQRLRRDLERRGYRVALTRSTDTRLKPTQGADLQARAELANRLGADLFLSLHFNALPDQPKVGGIETYVFTPAGQRSTAAHLRMPSDRTAHPGNRHDHWSAVLGATMHSRLVSGLGGEDRGLKRARFAVLRPLDCPAVLVEAGFLSNRAEAGRIATPAHRQRIAEAIGEGVGAYHARLTEARQAGGRGP